MSVFPIRVYGDPVLRTETKEVGEIDDSIRRLVADMIETMYDAPGVGLAANQVGVGRRIAVFDPQDDLGARVMINPRVVHTEGEFEMEEGCLSVPGYFWPITRPEYAVVEATNLEGEAVTYEGYGLIGRVLQHECGHLDGGLLLDAMVKKERKKALAEINRESMGL